MTHPIENIMQSSMEQIKRLADVDTVIGTPFRAEDGTLILPVSKVTLGTVVGGGEYAMTPAKKCAAEVRNDGGYPFMGASAVGMSLTPLAFLSVREGGVRVLPARQDCAADRLVDLLPQVMETAERLVKTCFRPGESAQPEKSVRTAPRQSPVREPYKPEPKYYGDGEALR